MNRQQILDQAFTRADLPGTRKLSAGILALARQLGLQFALAKPQQRELSAEDTERQGIALTWLLDKDVTLDFIRVSMGHGREFVFTEILPDYEMNLHPLKLMYAQKEVALTSAELEAASYEVERKPSEKPSEESPAGKS